MECLGRGAVSLDRGEGTPVRQERKQADRGRGSGSVLGKVAAGRGKEWADYVWDMVSLGLILKDQTWE